MRLEEILDKLYRQGDFEGEHRDIHPDRIAEAKQAINAYRLAELPKEKKKYERFEHNHHAWYEDCGYNQAIQDIRNKIESQE